MRIVLDLQNIQGPSKLRGIGRNAFALAQAMISIATEDEFYIILNKQFPEHIEQIRYDFRSIIPQSNIKIFDVPLGCTFNEGNYARIAAAELLRENFILNLKPDIIHIGSGLLESGPSIPGICSVGKLSSTKITVAATLHDFIPMTDPFLYLPDNNCKSLYKQRLDYISKTDLIFTVSQYTTTECLKYLPNFSGEIIPISAGVSKIFCKSNADRKNIPAYLKEKFGINVPFIFYVSAFDFRKNHEMLIKAFSELPYSIRDKHCLVFTCEKNYDIERKFKVLAQKYNLSEQLLILTGNINDEDLVLLYQWCRLFVFPSLAEGFGLPIIEAMACGAPVIGSDTTSIPELIIDPMMRFNPNDIDSIKNSIQKCLTDDLLLIKASEYGVTQAANFRWERSAKIALDSMRSFVSKKDDVQKVSYKYIQNKNIDFFQNISHLDLNEEDGKLVAQKFAVNALACDRQMISKFPRKTGWVTTWDKRCGIASYSKNIVCYLSQKPLILAQKGDRQHFNLEYTVIQCWNEGFTSGDKLYELEHVIVQHDLSEVHFQYNFDFFDPHYLYKLFSSLKKKGISIYITMHSTSNEKIINKLIPALQLADIIFVHAELDFYRLYKFINRNKVKFIPHGICNYNVSSRIKKYPNYNNHVHIISTYGFFLPNKGLLEIIQAIKILKLKGENIYLKMVNADYGRNISFPYIESCKKKIRELNLSENVEIISDYLDDEESLNLLCTTELIVFPYQKSGESASGAVRLGLCSGIPVAVSPLKIFDDVKDAVFTLPGIYPQNIADGIEEIFSHIANNSTHYTITAMHALQWRKSNDYANIVSYIDHQMALTSTVIDCLTAHQVKRQIFLDVSNIINYDHHTGIQRVVKGVLNSLLQKPPFGCSILPVYIKPFGKNFFYSAEFADKILNNVSNVSHPDVSICFYPGDIFFGLDWTPNYISHYNSVLSTMRNHGVSVKFRKRSQGSRH